MGPRGARKGGKAYVILRFLRIEQVFFSLPMAYMGAFLAIRGIPSIRVLLLILSALFFLRMAGITMDNLADREIDAANPRTRTRPLVTGAITVREAWVMILVGMIGFFLSAYLVNEWTLIFSPVVGAVVLSYPYMKRFTSFANYHLAAIQGLAVFSGAVASDGLKFHTLTQVVSNVPWLFVVSTILWAVGFDLYNHIPDAQFDREMGLHSFAVLLGGRALTFAGLNQLSSVLLAVGGDLVYSLGPISYAATVLHGLVMLAAYYFASRKGDFGRAFYYNIYSSVILGLGIILNVALLS
ncbi:4-hydroxybenzoate octaprenyltransferase [Sulfodiicoccus acidiphilus]|uniref:4-hydroxybenzoate octaprenyltransferase n=1 Tax=Sulfodiicoccus acidiphilus TaxID=1670455 RepID=A0A348B4M6_9CREN|nr:4-hydroxybenzoate octaprenyltransferase [Sulfodiicoccus acidiphilus]BBD73128.1 4-hydroxybenzoate octaprenyltransferase [Sulfodiicoccus acidiphilus]